MKKITKEKETIMERCGFCGRYFIGNEYVPEEELKKYTTEQLNNAPLGYCPEAKQEDFEQNPQNYPKRITKDMAIDIGQPELEGEYY